MSEATVLQLGPDHKSSLHAATIYEVDGRPPGGLDPGEVGALGADGLPLEHGRGYKTAARSREVSLSWPEWVDLLSHPLATNNKKRQGLRFRTGIGQGPGALKNASPVSLLALEWDSDATPEVYERAHAVFEREGWPCLTYTSASAAPENPRFRLVVVPSRPIQSAREYAACVSHVGRLVGAEPARESTWTQEWYRPIARGKCGAPRIWYRLDGRALDVDAAVAEYVAPKRTGPVAVPREEWRLGTVVMPAGWMFPRLRGEGEPDSEEVTGSLSAQTMFDAMREYASEAVAQGVDDPRAALPYLPACWSEPEFLEVLEARLAFARARHEERAGYAPEPVKLSSGVVEVPPGREALRAAMDEYVTDGATVFVIAGMNAGKTTSAIRLVEAADRALVVSPTQALALDWAARSEAITNYQTKRFDDPRLSTTLHSLHRCEGLRDLFVVDELPYVLSMVHTAQKLDRVRTYHDLIQRLATTPRAVALGADIDAELLEFLTSEILRVSPERRVVVLRQASSPEAKLDREIVLVSTDEVRVAVREAVQSGKKVACLSTGKAELKTTAEVLRAEGYRVGELHGDTGREMMADVNGWCEGLDLLCANHAAGAGVNITASFDLVVVTHRTREVSPSAVMQLVARVRNVSERRVLVGVDDWGRGSKGADPAAIEAAVRLKAEETQAVAPQHVVSDDRYLRAWVFHQARAARAWNEPWLWAAADQAGWGFVPQRGERPEVDTEDFRDARAVVREREVAAVVRADPGYQETGYERTPQGRASQLHRDVLEAFGRVDADLVKRWARGYGAAIWRYVAAVAEDYELLAARDAVQADGAHVVDVSNETGGVAVVVSLYRSTYGGAPGEVARAQASELRSRVREWLALEGHEGLMRRHLGVEPPASGKEVPWLHARLRWLGAYEIHRAGRNADRTYRVEWPPEEDTALVRLRAHEWRRAVAAGETGRVTGRWDALWGVDRVSGAEAEAAVGEAGGSVRRAAKDLGVEPVVVALAAKGGRPRGSGKVDLGAAREAIARLGSARAAAKELGVSDRAVRRALEQVA